MYFIYVLYDACYFGNMNCLFEMGICEREIYRTDSRSLFERVSMETALIVSLCLYL